MTREWCKPVASICWSCLKPVLPCVCEFLSFLLFFACVLIISFSRSNVVEESSEHCPVFESCLLFPCAHRVLARISSSPIFAWRDFEKAAVDLELVSLFAPALYAPACENPRPERGPSCRNVKVVTRVQQCSFIASLCLGKCVTFTFSRPATVKTQQCLVQCICKYSVLHTLNSLLTLFGISKSLSASTDVTLGRALSSALKHSPSQCAQSCRSETLDWRFVSITLSYPWGKNKNESFPFVSPCGIKSFRPCASILSKSVLDKSYHQLPLQTTRVRF